jgi:F-box interacting protein
MSVPRKSPRLLPNTRKAAAAVFSDDLIAEVLSFLPVKSLVQLKSVSKSWNNIISHPTFIKKHLKRSSQNPQFTLLRSVFSFTSVVPISVHHLLENPSNLITLTNDPYYWLKYNRSIVGSCNGLLCLLGYSSRKATNNIWLRFWNPSIRTISEKLGSFDNFSNLRPSSFQFAFGYDNSTDTYKVVALRDGDGEAKVKRTTVRVFSLGDNVWRDIENFPMVSFNFRSMDENCGIYVSNSLNWLGLGNDTAFDDFYHHIEKFLIVSLDMRKETYTMMLPPHEFY